MRLRLEGRDTGVLGVLGVLTDGQTRRRVISPP